MMASASSFSSSAVSSKTPVPRAAVSTVVRYHDPASSQPPTYLLIERGNPPNKGVWCVPGGKIELGETTLHAAQRELAEEVQFTSCDSHSDSNENINENNKEITLAWFAGGAFCTSDSITTSMGTTTNEGYHYVIGQCFAEIVISNATSDGDNKRERGPPLVQPADDAVAAKWWTLNDIKLAQAKQETVPNLVRVVERAEALHQAGMLPTTVALS
jgi:NUDIX domain